MEINDLMIFKTVVSEGSISKAAKELGYVQPNVTERIKKLEQELETSLLQRNSSGISLLPPGEILLNYAEKVLTLVEDAKSEIKKDGQYYRIVTTQSILFTYLSSRIKENLKDYQIYMENNRQLNQLLKNQKVDMAITYENYSNPAFQMVSSTSISIGLLKAKGRSKIDYLKESFFVSHDPQCPFRNYTIQFMEEHHLSNTQLHQIDSYTLITEFVTEGKGVAFLPIDDEKFERVEEVEIERMPIYFFTIRGSRKEPPAELFK
ncbi:LysR family transcriptional regulator [Bacillus sp. BRMEA1]|uniref:LysR family transcriptional regulator n=1 Tax=Neobacillus endophyticus TaxID=2738405 RepID=UPI001562FDD6|nr:LysR family transcriptional regulator [Neobacillus endophyticus]NRD77751.1 LysR family transcriptional regulator [Neobacillus endophyticus]